MCGVSLQSVFFLLRCCVFFFFVFFVFFFSFFFFSSRRRHTRFTSDWSSDVCSSDLTVGGYGGLVEFLSLPSSNIVKLPSHGNLSEWVVCQPASTAMYGCKTIGSWIGKTVAIIGDRKSVV